MVHYRDIDGVRAILDRRSLDYRFDLQADVPWELADEPGDYLPQSLLEVMGVDTAPLQADSEANRLFQWACALCVCRTFEVLEWGIIEFCRSERGALGNGIRSVGDLSEDEEKHIQLFRRFSAHLETQRPDLVAPFEEAFRDSFRFLTQLFEREEPNRYHLQTWLTALIFEPFSIYLAKRIESAEELMQPLWDAVHRLHAQEEARHVATVDRLSSALHVPEEAHDRTARAFFEAVTCGYRHLFCIATPVRLLRALRPDLDLDVRDGVPRSFVNEVLGSKYFTPLRRQMPTLAGSAFHSLAPERGRSFQPGHLPTAKSEPPRVVFLLSSERAGSTLLRAMLSGHPSLFAPPELNLLDHDSLEERARSLPRAQQYGLEHAWMNREGITFAEAEVRHHQQSKQAVPTREVYEAFFDRLEGRVLVDKSPAYSRDIEALRKAEQWFGGRVRYVFLSRHPYSTIASYAKTGLKRMVADDDRARRCDAYELGEMSWTLSNRTLLEFLADVDPARQIRVRFEDLLADPESTTRQLCAFMGVDFDLRVLDPYEHGQMVDDVVSGALVGDPNFRDKSRVEPERAEAWRSIQLPRALGPEARRIASDLGYELVGGGFAARPGDGVPCLSDSLRARILHRIANAAGLPHSELDDSSDLGSLGIDSLELLRLTEALEQELDCAVSAMTLVDHPVVGDLLSHLAGLVVGNGIAPSSERAVLHPRTKRGEGVDLRAECMLDDTIRPSSHAPRPRSNETFLTGATGFLGAYLLRELLERGTGDVACLTRAQDPEAAMQRLKANLQRYELWEDRLAARIVPLCGDLAAPRFGLAEESFRRLAERVGRIVHNGALLDFNKSYSDLRGPNVLGTIETLRLATEGPIKPVHYVSTTGVFDAVGTRDQQVDETTNLDDPSGIELGYAQSKWVAEQLVTELGKRGVPVTIFRCGGIGGHSVTGVSNTDDLLSRMLRGCAQMGVAPRVTFSLDVAPVDYVSQSIVWLLSQERSAGQVYHMNNPTPMGFDRVVAWMQLTGFPIREVDFADWAAQLEVEGRGDHPLAALVPYFCRRAGDNGLSLPERRHFQRPPVSCERTTNVLSEAGIACPPLDHQLLQTWFDHMRRTGALAA